MPLFLVGCGLTSSCREPFVAAFSDRYDRTKLYGLGGVSLLALFAFALTTRKRKQKYNSRWARIGDFAGRVFPMTSQKLSMGLQLAHLWKNLPETRKNRYGHLEVMDWGRQEGKIGGGVVAVVPQKTRKELGHVLIVGPTRCGKGLSLTQNLLCFAGSVAVNDPKGENLNRTGA